MSRATWVMGKKRIAGCWCYLWAADEFFIALDSGRKFRVKGDSPEWGGWKLWRV